MLLGEQGGSRKPAAAFNLCAVKIFLILGLKLYMFLWLSYCADLYSILEYAR
jgi:hypothetical protein